MANKVIEANLTIDGTISKTGGTSSQFLKADGSTDSSSYITSSGVTYEQLNSNGDVGSASGTLCAGNDSRLSDTRTPTDSTVTYAKLGTEYKNRVAMSGVDVDWSSGQVFTKTLTGNTTLTFSNTRIGVKDLEITGNYTLAFPSGIKIVSGTYTGTVSNFIQVVITNTSSLSGWATINQEV